MTEGDNVLLGGRCSILALTVDKLLQLELRYQRRATTLVILLIFYRVILRSNFKNYQCQNLSMNRRIVWNVTNVFIVN